MDEHIRENLRRLPKIDAVVAAMQDAGEILALGAPRWALVAAVRAEVAALREAIVSGQRVPVVVSPGALAARIRALVMPSLKRVINATGVVLHTNLGRAPLATAAAARVMELSSGYSNLEYDLDAGQRGSRHGHLTALLRELTGAEDAVVVNNNAAAVMLGLAALAAGREVVVSRGELVEIGGSFRIPDVMRLSGARLVEVGTTNKTKVADYRAVVGQETAMFLKVHQSNFAIVGFTQEVSLAELAELGRDTGVVTMMDLGSGSLLGASELAAAGLAAEPSVREVVAAGIDVVMFSGDKLLGGPQAGIVCGRSALIGKLRKHPLMRALRPDKMCLAALEATLALYRDGRARAEIPGLAMLMASEEAVRGRAEAACARLAEAGVRAELVACEARVGGGAMPLVEIRSWGLVPMPDGRVSATELERRLRAAEPPVVGRVAEDRVILDMRTVADEELDELVAAVAGAMGAG